MKKKRKEGNEGKDDYEIVDDGQGYAETNEEDELIKRNKIVMKIMRLSVHVRCRVNLCGLVRILSTFFPFS
jgi:hypothetical protein